MLTVILVVVFLALAFEYINGFHDTANSIATVVATKVLTPTQAVILAACTNLLGALMGEEVAKTIHAGIVQTNAVNESVILCALVGAIVWNLVTWYWGLPSSSSHALIGGLIGATIANVGNWNSIIWSQPNPDNIFKSGGVVWKLLFPMVMSPLLGFVLGIFIMSVLYVVLRNWKPRKVNTVFGKLQMVSAGAMGVMHGTNDAQKTMGIITLALITGTAAGTLDGLPDWLSFLRIDPPSEGVKPGIPLWIKLVCALVMAAGTAAGGWRIIKTLGHKMVKLQPVNGFAAETASACVIGLATFLGIPVSTTHNISSSIMGVGAAKRWNALRWTIVERMAWAWLFTIPISGLIAYLCVKSLKAIGWL